MSVHDLNNQHLSDEDKRAILESLDTIYSLLRPYALNFTKKQRQKYGSINEKNKLFVNKVEDYHINQPELDSPDVDWVEFTADASSRRFCETIISKLKSILKISEDKKISHDYDNHKSAHQEYDYTTYKVGTRNGSNWADKHEELRQFFPGPGTAANDDTQDNNDNEDDNETPAAGEPGNNGG